MMTKNPQKIFEQVRDLADQVKHDLKKKGLVVPAKDSNGNVVVGDYRIIKKDIFYYVYNKRNQAVTPPLNLAQTAIVIANKLALGYYVDDALVKIDRDYGYKAFDEENFTRSAERKGFVEGDVSRIRADIARREKDRFKSQIMTEFNRLRYSR